jgi:small subunit ribosomal protein S6
MKAYETIVVYGDTVPEADIEASTAKMVEALGKAGATEVTHELWGKRKLAYEIGKSRFGIYVVLRYRSTGPAPAAVEKLLRIEPGVLRFQSYVSTGTPSGDARHYRNAEHLVQFITDRGKIRPARSTRLNAAEQRDLARQIKRARHLALLPITTTGQ